MDDPIAPGGMIRPRDAVRVLRTEQFCFIRARLSGDSVTIVTMHSTKQRLLDTGQAMLLQHGYNDLGVQALLDATHIPKGSFYHHFKDKEDFALQVLDQYMRNVHAALDDRLSDASRAPLERVRGFFELTQQSYRDEGYMGCLIGGLGQELSGVSEVFRRKVEECFSQIAGRLAGCLEEARRDRRHSTRCRRAASGQSPGQLLGRRGPPQPAAPRRRPPQRHARLLLRPGRQSLSHMLGRSR